MINVVSGLDGRVEMDALRLKPGVEYHSDDLFRPMLDARHIYRGFRRRGDCGEMGTTFRTSPAIDGKTVAWSERDDNSARVMVKDLATGDARPVAQNASNEIFINSVQISDA